MSDPEQPDPQQLARRLTELESLYMHMQRTVQDLSDVIVEQQRREVLLQRQMHQLKSRLEGLEEGPEVRTLEDEKPPHY